MTPSEFRAYSAGYLDSAESLIASVVAEMRDEAIRETSSADDLRCLERAMISIREVANRLCVQTNPPAAWPAMPVVLH